MKLNVGLLGQLPIHRHVEFDGTVIVATFTLHDRSPLVKLCDQVVQGTII